MSSDERKVVHQYLSEFPNIKTESEGMGRDRHIVIKYVEEVEGSEETISEE
jgi:spoIIIJ-associated protein